MSAWTNPIAWLTAVTALFAAWIAYQQFRTGRHRLRLDLFDRRMSVYEATVTLVRQAVRDGDVNLEAVFRFVSDTRQAEFLFDDPVVEYLETVRKNAIQLRYLNERLHEDQLPVGEERNRVAEEEASLLKWYTAQAEGEVSKRFRTYLSFHDVR